MINIEAVFSSVTNFINKYISGILKSTLWTSVFIITIIFFILMTIFPTQREKPLYVIMKPILYMFFAVFATLFLHDSHILDAATKTISRENINEIVGGMEEFRNRETNIYKALNGETADINPRKYDNDVVGVTSNTDDTKSVTSERSVHDDVRSVTSDVSEGVVDTSVLLDKK